MKLPAGRQRVLYIVLVLVTIAWVSDLATRTRPVRSAQAADAAAPADAKPVPLEPFDEVERLLQVLESQSTEPPPVPEGRLRDPFELPAGWQQAQTKPHEPAETEPDPADDFAARHRLDGVLAGPNPVAIIDSVVCPIGARVEGFRVERIEPTRVVLRRGPTVVVLRLEPPEP